MHIGFIGGVERGEQRYAKAAASQGHSFEFHGGDMAGRGSNTLEALVERSDLVICVTDVNSHAAVLGARRHARAMGRRCCSPSLGPLTLPRVAHRRRRPQRELSHVVKG